MSPTGRADRKAIPPGLRRRVPEWRAASASRGTGGEGENACGESGSERGAASGDPFPRPGGDPHRGPEPFSGAGEETRPGGDRERAKNSARPLGRFSARTPKKGVIPAARRLRVQVSWPLSTPPGALPMHDVPPSRFHGGDRRSACSCGARGDRGAIRGRLRRPDDPRERPDPRDPGEDCPNVLMKSTDLGLIPRLRRGQHPQHHRHPTTGSTRTNFIDVGPTPGAMHHYILNHRELYGLPRKFNISYDSGGCVSALADTNDIGFYAVKVGERSGVEPGVYFRMQLCGITGHKQFATDCGVLLTPPRRSPSPPRWSACSSTTATAPTARRRASSISSTTGESRKRWRKPRRNSLPARPVPPRHCRTTLPKSKHGHLGIHQQTDGNITSACLHPSGACPSRQMTRLADIADLAGERTVRLTVWQNLIIPGIPVRKLQAAITAIQRPFDHRNNAITGGLIACTGSRGCKFAAVGHEGPRGGARRRASCQQVRLDQPVNIHLTGCPHSCAQHYIGDIGLLGTKVEVGDDLVEGYHLTSVGGYGDERNVAREIYRGVTASETPEVIERICSWDTWSSAGTRARASSILRGDTRWTS